MSDNLVCDNCGWHGLSQEVDTVTDPRPLPNTEAEVWMVCPDCRIPENLVRVCDEPNCWLPVSCGVNTTNGFRMTCSKHQPERVQ